MREKISVAVNVTSLDDLAAFIAKNYEDKSDEQLAEYLKIPVQSVIAIRQLKGLSRHAWSSAFESFRRIAKDKQNEYFVITLRLNGEMQKKLGLDFSRDYQFFARAATKKIEIEISERICE
jgi:hypothetical protein